MKLLIYNIVQFIETGNPNTIELKKTKFNLFLSTLLLDIILGLFAALIVSLLVLNIVDLEPTENLKSVNFNNNLIVQIFIGLIISPFIEEIIYRLFLKFSPINLAISATSLLYYLISLIAGIDGYCLSFNSVFLFIFCCGIFVASLLFFKRKANIISYYYNSKFRFILYVSIVLFAYGHISNYHLSAIVLVLSPILLMPQIISGILYSFIRLKLGFWFSVSMHILSNLCIHLFMFSNL
jgi:hypothetical protein